MRIKTVSITYERKFNLGDYNSANIGCTVWADVDEGETPEQALAQCEALAKNAVKEQAAPLFSKQTAQVKEFFAGLPTELQTQITEGVTHGNHRTN